MKVGLSLILVLVAFSSYAKSFNYTSCDQAKQPKFVRYSKIKSYLFYLYLTFYS